MMPNARIHSRLRRVTSEVEQAEAVNLNRNVRPSDTGKKTGIATRYGLKGTWFETWRVKDIF
jgi:hypothetical protein